MNNKICAYVKEGKCTNPCAEAIECPACNNKDESYDTCDWFVENKPNLLIEKWNDESKFYMQFYPSCIDGGGLRINIQSVDTEDPEKASIRLTKEQVKQMLKEIKGMLKNI